MVKKQENIKINLSKRQLSKLKCGGSVVLKKDDIDNGDTEVQVNNSKAKKMLHNKSKNKGCKLKLGEDESLDGMGVQRVGNTRQAFNHIKVPKTVFGGCNDCEGGTSMGGAVDVDTLGMRKAEPNSNAYNTFVKSYTKLYTPKIPHNLDQSYHFKMRVNDKYDTNNVLMGGKISRRRQSSHEGSPLDPLPRAKMLDQSIVRF